jgi:transposase
MFVAMEGSQNMILAVGIDVHKEKCAACAVYAGQGRVKEKQISSLEKFNEEFRRFPSDASGMKMLADRLRDHEAEILIENSTKAHNVFWMLTNLGLKVTVAHAADLYRITRSVTKNDDNDAKELAGYMRRRMMGEIEFSVSHIPGTSTLISRELCRFDLNDRFHLSSLKRQIRSHLLIRGLDLSKKYEDITSAGALMELKGIDDIIIKLDAAKAEEIRKRILFTEKTMRMRMMGNRTFDIIWSVPGFGILSASYVACMIDDMGRFEDGRAFAASMGIIPKMDESADKGKNCGISRRGDPDLRRLVCQATFVHIFHTNSFISDKYKRLKAAGKHHNEALVACANSMARMIFAMIRDDRTYVAEPETLAEARYAANSEDIEEIMGKAE